MTIQSLRSRHIPIRESWLALHKEAPIDPERPIIDSHHHLWAKPNAEYMSAEFAADASTGHNIVATVFVEARTGYRTSGALRLQSLGETEMVVEDVEQHSRSSIRIAAGIVGNIDLSLGSAVDDLLDRHIEASGGRFKGVRDSVVWHPDPEARGSIVSAPPGVLYNTGFRNGLAELNRRELVFDAWMYHTQLNDLVDLAHAMPDTRIVLNHIGGPIGIGPYAGRRCDVFKHWGHELRRLAQHENISVKLGGMGMLMAGFSFQDLKMPPSSDDLAYHWAPYIRSCIDIFGPDRCMFESNFPVDKGTAAYSIIWNAFKKISAPYSDEEKKSLFFASAERVYRLGLKDVSTSLQETSREN